jgi:prevent-host-death family protein
MIQTNISTLKSQLSRFIDQVKAGEQVVISDRNQEVAVLCPYAAHSGGDWSGRVAELRRRGQVAGPREAGESVRMCPLRVHGKRPANLSDAIIQERRAGR